MNHRTLLAIALSLGISSGTAFAQMDVDQADSLNFSAFHKDKKEAIKVWNDDKTTKNETIKTYDQSTTAATQPTAASTTPAASATALTSTPVTAAPTTAGTATKTAATTTAPAAPKAGQHYEIRDRYTFGHSAKTPYSAFYVIESLQLQSAKLCPKGWKKLSERSEPVEQDYFLYYEIECL